MEIELKSVNYSDLKDEELIDLIRKRDDYAEGFLMNKYKLLVEKKSSSYFLIGATKEDLIQEGMIGLFKAIRDYKKNKEASFFSFAELCITRQMITAVKASTRQKHKPLNTYVSLYKPSFVDNDDQELINFMPNKKVANPEELYILNENIHAIEKELVKKLSDLEKEVLQLHIDGTSYTEVADILERPIKSVDNALQRIKKKVEKILDELDEQ